MAVIFSGKTLVAQYNPGDTPFMLVTFIGAFHEDTVESLYLMKDIVTREGMACVGVTARVRNLYVSDEINEIATLVRELRRPNQKLIVLGQSSGGYAAIKFANLFNADYVVSFSPIFSVDEEDLGLTPDMQQEREFLKIALRFHRVPADVIRPGMRPGPEDCSVPVFFAYSIQTSADGYAADRYENLFPSAFFLRIKHLGHAIFDYMNDGDTLVSLMDCLAHDDLDGAAVVLKRSTRRNETALAETMLRIARWRPSILPLVLQTARVRQYVAEETRKNHVFNTVAAYEMVARGDVAGACAHLRELHPGLFPEDGAGSGLFLVLSWHGDLLSYDTGASQVVLAPDALRLKTHVPVLVDTRGATPRMMIRTRAAGALTVIPDKNGAAERGEGFEVVPALNGPLVSFRRGNLFMSGFPKSVPAFGSAEALGWDFFAMLPVPEEAASSHASSLSWFEESLVAVHLGNNAPKPAPGAEEDGEAVRRKVAFRSFLRFFGR